MIIGLPKEIHPGEKRVALLPGNVQQLVQKGATVLAEPGFAGSLNLDDKDYQKAGVQFKARSFLLETSDLLLRVRKPPKEEVQGMKKSAAHISFLDPFSEQLLVRSLAENQISAISLEMLPRATITQKMDALSSQANLSGYAAVLWAAFKMNKIFPMMMTPAGTISPVRVFIIGAGVAGLQAIATARRLGAQVEAYDTRPVVEEQVKSLGAKFIRIDLGETGQTQDGYAKPLTPEQIERQRQAMLKVCARADIVITAAQVFGKKAPTLITQEMLSQMKPGTLVIDMAIENGGNVEGAKMDQEIELHGVHIFGLANLPSQVCLTASQMFGNNMVHLLETFWDENLKGVNLDMGHDILKSCLITHQGRVIHPQIKKLMES